MRQERHSDRFVDAERLEQLKLLDGWLADTSQALIAELDAMLLQTLQKFQCGRGAVHRVGR